MVKRYSFVEVHPSFGESYSDMCEKPNGEYVEYMDYKKLQDEFNLFKQSLTKMMTALTSFGSKIQRKKMTTPGRKISTELYKAYCAEQRQDLAQRWKFADLLNWNTRWSGILFGKFLGTEVTIKHIENWPPKGENVDLIKITCGESTPLVGTTVSIHGTDEDRQAALLTELEADKTYLLDWITKIDAAKVILSKLTEGKDDA